MDIGRQATSERISDYPTEGDGLQTCPEYSLEFEIGADAQMRV